MQSRDVETKHTTIARKWYPFGTPTGGRFRYMLDASGVADATMPNYLPPPRANTRLLFMCIDASVDVTLNASSKAPIEGSTSTSCELEQYQAIEFVADMTGTPSWRQHRKGDKII